MYESCPAAPAKNIRCCCVVRTILLILRNFCIQIVLGLQPMHLFAKQLVFTLITHQVLYQQKCYWFLK